jgi:hypothetical protein
MVFDCLTTSYGVCFPRHFRFAEFVFFWSVCDRVNLALCRLDARHCHVFNHPILCVCVFAVNFVCRECRFVAPNVQRRSLFRCSQHKLILLVLAQQQIGVTKHSKPIFDARFQSHCITMIDNHNFHIDSRCANRFRATMSIVLSHYQSRFFRSCFFLVPLVTTLTLSSVALVDSNQSIIIIDILFLNNMIDNSIDLLD